MPARAFNFNSIPAAKVGRTTFDLSCTVKGAFPLGKAIPLFVQECVPGDYFKVSAFSQQRLMALISPMMQNVDVHMDFFYMPSRLLHKDFNDFRTGGEDGKQAPTVPQMNLGDIYNTNTDCLAPGIPK